MNGDETSFGDPSRRTYLSHERTLLSWWRTGFAAAALAFAVGRVLPVVGHLPRVPYLVLGCAYGLLAVVLFSTGLLRHKRGQLETARGDFAFLSDRLVIGLTFCMIALTAATVIVSCVY